MYAARGRCPLSSNEVRLVGSGVADGHSAVAWITVGETLAVSGFVPTPGGDGFLLLEGIAGQATLSSVEADEAAVLDVLGRRHGQLAVEQVLCGAGIVEMYRAVCLLRGIRARRMGVAQIAAAAVAARDAQCSRAMTMFCGLLGDLAGSAALALGARGGVVIAGDIVPALGEWFVRSPFRRRFDSRGRYRETLRAIPTAIVLSGATPTLTNRLPVESP